MGAAFENLKIIENLKIYNLTTTNAAIMKLTMIKYLHTRFNVVEDWEITHRG